MILLKWFLLGDIRSFSGVYWGHLRGPREDLPRISAAGLLGIYHLSYIINAFIVFWDTEKPIKSQLGSFCEKNADMCFEVNVFSCMFPWSTKGVNPQCQAERWTWSSVQIRCILNNTPTFSTSKSCSKRLLDCSKWGGQEYLTGRTRADQVYSDRGWYGEAWTMVGALK